MSNCPSGIDEAPSLILLANDPLISSANCERIPVLSIDSQSCDFALNCAVDDSSHNMILPVTCDVTSNDDVDNLATNYPLISVDDDVITRGQPPKSF